MRLPRASSLAIASAALLAVDIALYVVSDPLRPNPIHIAAHKLDLLSLGAWAGYLIDRVAAPYARPHESFVPGHHFIGALLMLRRALIMTAAMLVMGLGL